MELEKLLLKKEEIQFRTRKDDILTCPMFYAPIHPRLLEPDVRIDPRLAIKIFPDAAKDWYKDLQAFEKTLKKGDAKSYINDLFLSKPLAVNQHYDSYRVDPPGYWEANAVTMENGFANSISIDRNAGGSLYLDINHPDFISPPSVKFTKEKFQEFSCQKDRDDFSQGATAHIYHFHNVDYYPGALFLRNWAILYLNEALKQVFKQ